MTIYFLIGLQLPGWCETSFDARDLANNIPFDWIYAATIENNDATLHECDRFC